METAVTSKVLIKSRHINPYNKEVRANTLSIMDYTLKAENGGGTITRQFLNDNGEADILRIPENGVEWIKGDAVHDKNIALAKDLLKQKPEVFNSEFELIDLDISASQKSNNKILAAKLISKLDEANSAGNTHLLYGLARLFMGNVESQTVSVVFDFLTEEAIKNPEQLNKILNDADFEYKVNTYKLIDKSLIFKSAEGLYKINGSIVASTFDELILFLKQQDDLYNGLLFRIGKTKPLGVESRVEPVIQADKILAAEDMISIDITEETKVPNALNVMSQVAKWLEAGLFEKTGNEYAFNGILIGKNNKEIADFMMKNIGFMEHVKTLYKSHKENKS